VSKAPADCNTKEDVRAEIDRIDQVLLGLFAERHKYVTRMANSIWTKIRLSSSGRR
jgi:isochorismate pyruvate lyase